MKVLLIGDTHGRVDSVNELAAKTGADCCFHLGDLGFCTRDSVGRFSADGLRKQLEHAPQLPPERLASVAREDAGAMRRLAIEYRTYGNFEDYLSGKKRFEIPVYAVPGNNDDAEVLTQLEAHPIENLTVLNEKRHAVLNGRYLVYGIGGEIAASVSAAPDFGTVSTWRQVSALAKNVSEESKKHTRLRKIQLTHIPPDGDSALRGLMKSLAPDWAFGGHTHHWNEPGSGDRRVVVLPCVERGYALLTLDNDKEVIAMIDQEIKEVIGRRSGYERQAKFVEAVLHRLFAGTAHIQVRVKRAAGIAEKILSLRKNSAAPARLPADIVGARLIFLRKDRLADADGIIAEHFEVVERQNVQDRLSTREFGYLSRHYIVKCAPARIADELGAQAPDGAGLPPEFEFELQVRTWLQHVWAELEHDSVYKVFRAMPDRVPPVRREWAMLAAMLEKLDDDLIACLQKTEAVKWPYVNKSEARQQLGDLLRVSEVLEGSGCRDEAAGVADKIDRLRRLLEGGEPPGGGDRRTEDPLNPENFIRHLEEVPTDMRTWRVFSPQLAERCRKMIESSNDLPWAFAGIVLGGILRGDAARRGTDEEREARESETYDAALRLIDLCNARSIANLVGRDLVATGRTKAALHSLRAVVKNLRRRDETAKNIAAILDLGSYAHRLDGGRAGAASGKDPVVILSGGCAALETGDAPEALEDFKKLFRETLKGGVRKMTFHTGYGRAGICSLKDIVNRTGKNRPYTVESFPGKRPERHSVADALGGWQALKRAKYDFDDVALIGFGVRPRSISELECKIALAFGARVTVIRHDKLPGMGFDDIPYWSAHPSLVKLPQIGSGEPRNRSFAGRERARDFCSWCRDRGFPEPEMVRGFMLFRTFHEDDFDLCRDENDAMGRLARVIHWQKQMRMRKSDPRDMEEMTEEHLNSLLHRLFMLDGLLRDIDAADPGAMSRRNKFRYGEKEHARWYVERWLQGCRYGKEKTGNLNPCMVSWYDLDDEAIQKDISYLERVQKAKNADYAQCREDFTAMLRSRRK